VDRSNGARSHDLWLCKGHISHDVNGCLPGMLLSHAGHSYANVVTNSGPMPRRFLVMMRMNEPAAPRQFDSDREPTCGLSLTERESHDSVDPKTR